MFSGKSLKLLPPGSYFKVKMHYIRLRLLYSTSPRPRQQPTPQLFSDNSHTVWTDYFVNMFSHGKAIKIVTQRTLSVCTREMSYKCGGIASSVLRLASWKIISTHLARFRVKLLFARAHYSTFDSSSGLQWKVSGLCQRGILQSQWMLVVIKHAAIICLLTTGKAPWWWFCARVKHAQQLLTQRSQLCYVSNCCACCLRRQCWLLRRDFFRWWNDGESVNFHNIATLWGSIRDAQKDKIHTLALGHHRLRR